MRLESLSLLSAGSQLLFKTQESLISIRVDLASRVWRPGLPTESNSFKEGQGSLDHLGGWAFLSLLPALAASGGGGPLQNYFLGDSEEG